MYLQYLQTMVINIVDIINLIALLPALGLLAAQPFSACAQKYATILFDLLAWTHSANFTLILKVTLGPNSCLRLEVVVCGGGCASAECVCVFVCVRVVPVTFASSAWLLER